jgi:hypothetical protein
MRLTDDQMFEITTAVRCGLAVAGLAAVPAEERRKWRELAYRRLEAELKSLGERERLIIEEGLALSEQREELAERQRQRYYAVPEKERTRRPAGMRMALNDLLSQSQHFGYAQRDAIDHQLKRRGLPSLTMLEIVLKRKHERILKRGSIRDHDEYYLVKEVLCDMSFDISDADRTSLERLASEYEKRSGQK